MNQDREREIAARLQDVRERIASVAGESGRQADEITLIAVSKTFPMRDILALVRQGQRVFGENRLQEAQGKWEGARERISGLELHFLGPLQTNKTRDVVDMFDVLHSLDRPKLARALARAGKEGVALPRCFIQVNTGEEEGKSGLSPADVDDFVGECRDELGLPVVGLMCLPPVWEEASLHFALLEKMARRNDLDQLSMGMSGDFEAAIRLGATHVRVGTGLFGQRRQMDSRQST